MKFVIDKERHCYLCWRDLPDLPWYERVAWGALAPENRCPPQDDWNCYQRFLSRGDPSVAPDPDYRLELQQRVMQEFNNYNCPDCPGPDPHPHGG